MKKIALAALFVFTAGFAYAEEAKKAEAAAKAGTAAVAEEAWKTRTFTAEELKKFDGKNGQPAYAAVNGIVYDLSAHKGWKTGAHMGHKAGLDLTKEMAKAPKAMHGEKNFAKYPKVGVLKDAAPVIAKGEGKEEKKETAKEEKKAEKDSRK